MAAGRSRLLLSALLAAGTANTSPMRELASGQILAVSGRQRLFDAERAVVAAPVCADRRAWEKQRVAIACRRRHLVMRWRVRWSTRGHRP